MRFLKRVLYDKLYSQKTTPTPIKAVDLLKITSHENEACCKKKKIMMHETHIIEHIQRPSESQTLKLRRHFLYFFFLRQNINMILH